MAGSSAFIRPLVSVLLVSLTLLGLMNVYSDNADQVKMASEVACGAKVCETNMVQMQRSVLAQSFVFQTRPIDGKGDSSTVSVECARQYVFAGRYECVVK